MSNSSIPSLDVKKLSAQYSIQNLSVAIAANDSEIFAFGESHTNASYPLYSITKTFISVLLLKLAEEGKANLDDKVSNWVPNAPEAESYSIRQLLNNTSGLPDYFATKEYGTAVRTHPQKPWSRDEYIKHTYQGKLLFEPGSGWMYSNLGYMFLKEIIEKVTSRSFSQALEENIFSPLQLKTCRALNVASDWKDLVPSNSVHLSLDGHAKEVSGLYHPGWVAHGVIAATASDVAKFFYKVFCGDFINQKSLAEMKTLVRVPGEHPPAVTPSYGLGIMADPDSKHGKSYGHGGGGPGYALHAIYWEETRTVAVALGNNEHAKMPELMNDLASISSESNI